MPTLGFLKKKRTKEGSSNPASPVTPTTPKPFDSSSAATSSSQPRASPQRPAGSSLLPQQHPPAPPAQAQVHPASAPNPSPATEQQQQQQQGQQQLELSAQQMNPAGTQSSPPPPHDSQNLPTINNLINPPQHDGAAAGSNPPSQFQAPLAPEPATGPSTSPGTDPALMLQQQQQSHPTPDMQSNQNYADHQSQQQQTSQQPPPQYQQMAPQDQQQQQVGQNSTPRVTKGKYSLADFDILRTLGTGSFGRVHLVQSKHNQRFYAVKVLKKPQVVKMKQVEHTNDERRMLSDVKHPFLITLWGTFQDWKSLYMVMDFVEGGELFSLLRKSGVSLPQQLLL